MTGKIHFMGIGGSGASACSVIAKSYGYDVEGSNQTLDTPYIRQVVDSGIKVFEGHKEEYLDDVVLLVISPAIEFNKNNQFVDYAKSKGVEVITWQEFSGKYLQKNKKVICVSGTHGKSTTTAMLGLVFENAGLDPTVLVGAEVKEWGRNYRVGTSNIFITESDEFYNNFLNYSPEVILLNNIEFDHPDFFDSLDEVKESFTNHINSLKGDKILILNADDQGINDIVRKIDLNNIKTIGYSILGQSKLEFSESYLAIPKTDNDFRLQDTYFRLAVGGVHNIRNSLGVIIASRQFGISDEAIVNTLVKFKGIGRRMDLVVDGDIKVYDDYAHHPTAIRVTLETLRNNTKGKVIAVVEPHSFSRTKALLADYKRVFDSADVVILAPIYKARDDQDFGIRQDSIVNISGHVNIITTKSIEEAAKVAIDKSDRGDTIIVMGAGDSFKITRLIKDML